MEKCDAFVVVYSVVDKASFTHAEQLFTSFMDMDLIRTRPVILVANKIDLARSRAVSSQGKSVHLECMVHKLQPIRRIYIYLYLNLKKNTGIYTLQSQMLKNICRNDPNEKNIQYTYDMFVSVSSTENNPLSSYSTYPPCHIQYNCAVLVSDYMCTKSVNLFLRCFIATARKCLT